METEDKDGIASANADVYGYGTAQERCNGSPCCAHSTRCFPFTFS